MPFQAATDLDLGRHRQLVGHGGGQRIARDKLVAALIISVGDVHIGVAAADLQAGGQFARRLQFNPAALVRLAIVHIAAQCGVVTGIRRHVVLLGVEHRCRDIQFIVEQTTFDPGLITLAFQRVDNLALGVQAVLRVKDFGVAGIHRVLLIQVVDHPGVRRDLAVNAHIAGGVVVFAIAVSAEHACAGDQVQVIGEVKPRPGIEALLPIGVVGGRGVCGNVVRRLGDIAVQGVLQRHRGVVRRSAVQRGFLGVRARDVGAEGQLMLTPAEAERAAERQIAIQLSGIVLVLGGQAGIAGGRRAVAVDVEHVGVFTVFHRRQGQRRLPVILEAVFPLGKGAGGVHVPIHPRLGNIRTGAVIVDRVAVGIGQRQCTPTGAIGVGLLVFDADSQGVAVGQVKSQQATENVLFPGVAVEVGVARVIGVNKTAAHIA